MNLIIFAAVLITAIITLVAAYACALRTDKRTLLTIDDVDIPARLPLFKNHIITRGVRITGDLLYMTWKHEKVETSREFKLKNFKTYREFEQTWQYQECQFYLRNVELFDKPVPKVKKEKTTNV